jgi:hypothetical protein
MYPRRTLSAYALRNNLATPQLLGGTVEHACTVTGATCAGRAFLLGAAHVNLGNGCLSCACGTDIATT